MYHVNDLQEYGSTRKLAESYGLKVYDTALPMDWYDAVHDRLGIWPQAYGFVWCYDVAKTFGSPFPLTEEANLILEIDAHVSGANEIGAVYIHWRSRS